MKNVFALYVKYTATLKKPGIRMAFTYLPPAQNGVTNGIQIAYIVPDVSNIVMVQVVM